MPSLRRLRPRPNAGVAMLLFALLVGACAGGETLRSRNQDANAAYNRKSYQEALEIYHELIAQRPDIAELSHNAGNALHRANLYERAVQETQRALPPDNDRIGALTYYALGNHYMALEEYELAYDSYRSALLLDPTDQDAKYNLELALLVISGQMQQPPPQAGQPGPGQGEQGGEQQQPGQQGEGDGQPPSPDQQPGQPAQPGQPQQTGSGDANQPSAAEVTRLLEEALRGLNDSLTYDEAQRILDLLRQQQQNQRLPGGGTTPAGPDY